MTEDKALVERLGDNLKYLVSLADWASGEGFCQLEGLDDPDEWLFSYWVQYGPPNGDGYSADAVFETMFRPISDRIGHLTAEVERLQTKLADMNDSDVIARTMAENERLREALGWFLNDSRFVVQVGGNPNVVPQMIEAAWAALEGEQ